MVGVVSRTSAGSGSGGRSFVKSEAGDKELAISTELACESNTGSNASTDVEEEAG